MEIAPQLDIRRLPNSILEKLTSYTNFAAGHDFTTLMRLVPKNLDDCFSESNSYARKYTERQIQMIINAIPHAQDQLPQLIFEWGTSNDLSNPVTVRHLVALLEKGIFYRASGYLRNLAKMLPRNATRETIQLSQLPDISLLNTAEQGAFMQPTDYRTVTLYNSTNEKTIQRIAYSELIKATGGFNKVVGKARSAKVYLAADLVSEKLVVVKLLEELDDKLVKKYLNEVKMISELSHPNIMKLLGYAINWNEEPISLGLVYKLAQGGSLKRRFLDGASYTFLERVKHLLEVSEAIRYLHEEHRVVHKRIKPGHILLHENTAFLADFELTDCPISLNEAQETDSYYAPEYQYRDTTAKLDIFSIGVVILEAVTGFWVYDKNRKPEQLVTYIKAFTDVKDILRYIGVLCADYEDETTRLITLGLKCVESEKDNRPGICRVRQKLKNIFDKVDIPQVVLDFWQC